MLLIIAIIVVITSMVKIALEESQEENKDVKNKQK